MASKYPNIDKLEASMNPDFGRRGEELMGNPETANIAQAAAMLIGAIIEVRKKPGQAFTLPQFGAMLDNSDIVIRDARKAFGSNFDEFLDLVKAAADEAKGLQKDTREQIRRN